MSAASRWTLHRSTPDSGERPAARRLGRQRVTGILCTDCPPGFLLVGIDPAGEDHISAFRGFTGQGFQWKTRSDIPAGIW